MGVNFFAVFGVCLLNLAKVYCKESRMEWAGSGTPTRPLKGGKLNFAHFEHFRLMFCAFFSAKAVFKNKSEVISLESIFTK